MDMYQIKNNMNNNTLESKKTEAKISVETKLSGDDTIYTLKSKKGQFEVIGKGDGSLLISTSAKTMNSAIGGRGEDNGENAWITDKHCRSNSEAVSIVLELLMVISE